MASARNTEKPVINTNYFMGGITVDPKLGTANSFYQSEALDFRSKPSQMSVLPGNRALTTNLPDLMLDMDQDLNGVRWGIGSAGNIYQIDTSNNVSNVGNIGENSGAGITYNQVTDQLYIPGQTTVSMYGQVTSGRPFQPQLRPKTFAQSVSINNGCTQLFNSSTGNYDGALRSVASASYTVPTGLTETSGTYCVFSPDIEPGYSISVFIVNKGTGNWTLTLHDSQNNSLASVTIANASVTSNAFNEFVFGSQIRMLVGGGIASGAANYHFHLTSTTTDGTVQVVPVSYGNSATGDMLSVNMQYSAYRLVQTNNTWHPTALFNVQTGTGNGQAICIGNGQYLATYNFENDSNPSNNSFVRHQLVFKYGYEVCGLSTNNQYLVIAVERRSTNASHNFQEGALYFWDGTTPQPSFVIDIPMGAPYGLYTFNNITYFTVSGALYAWSGGQTVIKVRRLGYQTTDYLGVSDTTIVNPNTMASRYNLLLLAYPSFTTNTSITYGTWSWGSVELTFPNAFGLSYIGSHGYRNNNTGGISNLNIGFLKNFVDSLYSSWKYTDANGDHYGLDIVDNTSSAANFASWMSLIFDGGARYKQKQAGRLKISFTALPAGCTVTPFYIIDRGTKVYGNPTNTTGDTSVTQDINKRYYEIQYGFEITCPVGLMTPPDITSVAIETDLMAEEVQVINDQREGF